MPHKKKKTTTTTKGAARTYTQEELANLKPAHRAEARKVAAGRRRARTGIGSNKGY